MVASTGFSKVTADLTDEEDDRQAAWKLAQTRFKKAVEAYSLKGSVDETLQLFIAAEEALSPLLSSSGLTGLREPELEMVLKGRLHRAVIIAHLEDLPDRWTQVKALVEDVLQFDYSNCNARWLRGLALLHGFQLNAEAEDEMRRAVDCSRQQNQHKQADQWETEIESAFSPAADAPTAAPAETLPTEPAPKASKERAPSPKAAARKSSTSLKGGFFNNKSAAKTAGQKSAAAPSAEAAPVPAPVPVTAANAATVADAPAASSRRESDLQAELQALQESFSRREAELLEEARALRERASQDQRRHQDWRGDLLTALDTLGEEIEEGLVDGDEEEAANSEEVLRSLGGQVDELVARSSEDRTWAEASHQKHMDVATEVSTLREMCSQETKERQDGVRSHTTDVKDLTKRFGELKGATKTLRDGLRVLLGSAASDAEAEGDAGTDRVTEQAREFKALPSSAKFGALLGDAAILRVLVVFVLLGMLVALGISVEAFGSRRCRFACNR